MGRPYNFLACFPRPGEDFYKFDILNEKEKEKLLQKPKDPVKEMEKNYEMTHYYCSAMENFNVEEV